MEGTIETLLTTEQVCKILRVTSRTIRNLTKDKRLKHIKIGASVRFSPADLREYMRAATRG